MKQNYITLWEKEHSRYYIWLLIWGWTWFCLVDTQHLWQRLWQSNPISFRIGSYNTYLLCLIQYAREVQSLVGPCYFVADGLDHMMTVYGFWVSPKCVQQSTCIRIWDEATNPQQFHDRKHRFSPKYPGCVLSLSMYRTTDLLAEGGD